jgi:hypothetical protein
VKKNRRRQKYLLSFSYTNIFFLNRVHKNN